MNAEALLASIPTELGWGALAVLLLRALLMQIPRIVEAISKALEERATAQRLSEQAKLTENQTEQAESEERRRLHERVDQLEAKLASQERAAADEIAKVKAQHDREKAEWAAALEQLRAEFEERIAESESNRRSA